MGHFETALGKTLIVEGEGRFSEDPKDSGGGTRWGVTEKVARAHGYVGPMRELPKAVAVAVYRTDYWDVNKLSGVAFFSPSIAYEMFDSAVNLGAGVAAKWLQRCLNGLNQEGSLWKDLVVDGDIGPASLTALRVYFEQRRGEGGEAVLLALLNALQGARYLELVEARPKDEKWLYGWLKQRVVQ